LQSCTRRRLITLRQVHHRNPATISTTLTYDLGEPAELPKGLRPRKWPHFMEKRHKPKEQIYHSDKILGQLYDKVESVNFVPHYTQPFDRRIRYARTPTADTLEISRQLKAKYDTAMRRIMAQQEIGTEFEVWSAFSLSKPRVGTDYKLQEELANIAGALKDRFRRICIEAAGGKDSEHLEPFVAAMYQVTWEEMEIALTECRKTKIVGGNAVPIRRMESKYMPLISFPWLFYEVLGRLASGVAQREDPEASGMSFSSTVAQPERLRKMKLVDVSDFDAGVETEQGIIHLGEEFDLECLPEHHTLTASALSFGENRVGTDDKQANADDIRTENHHKCRQLLEEEEIVAGLEQESPLEKLTKLTGNEDADDGEVEIEEIVVVMVEENSPLTRLAKLTEAAGKEGEGVEAFLKDRL
jgi:hypothetical protein